MVFQGAKKRSGGQDHVLSPFAYFFSSLPGCVLIVDVLEAGVGGLHCRPHLGGEGEGEVGGVDHTVLAHQAQGNLAQSLFQL